MKENFLALCGTLGVKPDFKNPDAPTEAELGAALAAANEVATSLTQKAAAESKAAIADRAIRTLVAESNNALNYDAARQVLADRAAHAARKKETKK